MAVEVRFRPAARSDLFALHDYVAKLSGERVADRLIGRIEDACQGLENFPERGRARDNLRAGIRTLALGRRAIIVYRLGEQGVEIGRVLYRGRDLAAVMASPDEG